ncbi:ferredoxin [Actinoplanes sp. NPDC049599]|uniref:ferredoxin n=1 Tax=Actinoplanes sp. NPDC049599 TaxID=3363903 RepID=UPI0037BD719F
MSNREPAARARLRVDPVACDGIGMCVHLAPGLITLDRWGYPIIAGVLSRGADVRAARAATAGCPRRALLLEISGQDSGAAVAISDPDRDRSGRRPRAPGVGRGSG